MIGQGYDCNFGVSGSFSGFGNFVNKSQKQSFKAKKKLLQDGGSNTVGYKYYDFYQEATIDGWVGSASGNTGTVAPPSASVGTTVTVANSNIPSLNGNWSLDGMDINGQVEQETGVTMNLSRYTSTTIV